MSNLVQYPLRQNVVTQIVSECGQYMLYCFVIHYETPEGKRAFQLWAKDEQDATAQVYHIMQGAYVAGRLSDNVVPQTRSYIAAEPPEDPSPGVA